MSRIARGEEEDGVLDCRVLAASEVETSARVKQPFANVHDVVHSQAEPHVIQDRLFGRENGERFALWDLRRGRDGRIVDPGGREEYAST